MRTNFLQSLFYSIISLAVGLLTIVGLLAYPHPSHAAAVSINNLNLAALSTANSLKSIQNKLINKEKSSLTKLPQQNNKDIVAAAPKTPKLEDAYVIGAENFRSWSTNYDPTGYLKVLPHPDVKVPFKDPFADWQAGRPGNYISSWGPDKDLKATLKVEEVKQLKIDGLGILKTGESTIPWLGNKSTPYKKLRGYNGQIPGPVIITEPGDTLKITLQNNINQGTNLHTHGLHVSPMGYGDNVVQVVKPGESWPNSIDLPTDAYIGLDWYHPHLHGVTNEQVASGLGGNLIILTPHNLKDLNPRKEPFHFMALNSFGLQQIDRVGSSTDPLNQNPSTPVPAGTPVKVDNSQGNNPIYTLSDAPFQGYNGKPVSYNPKIPTGDPSQKLFDYGSGPQSEPVENVIHTVNGQYNPTIDTQTGQWNYFSLTNMSTNTFHILALVKREGEQLIPQNVQIIGLDGDVSGAVSAQNSELSTLPLLSPGQRIAFQEWFEQPGTYYILSNGTDEILDDKTPSILKGKKGFSDGHFIWGPQVLATINVTGASVPQGPQPRDYALIAQFAQKNDKLIAEGQAGNIDRERTFVWSANLGGSIGLGHAIDDTNVKTFEGAYGINNTFFAENFTDSMVPLTMPMLGTKEVWNIVNTSGTSDPNLAVDWPLFEWHPFHIHQNDFTVLSINGIAATDIKNTYINGALQDTFSIAPAYDPSVPPSPDNPYGVVAKQGGKPSSTKVLMEIEDYPGTFVNHCHILFHEDAGMMAAVRVILNTEDTWLSSSSPTNLKGEVALRRANNPQKQLQLAAYGESYRGAVQVATGDVNYKQKAANNNNVTDNVTDVAVVQSVPVNGKLAVKVFDGKALINKQEAGQKVINGEDSSLVLAQFVPFQNLQLTNNTKTAIAVGDINGDGFSDVIVGIGGDRQPLVEIYSGKDYRLMARLNPLTTDTLPATFTLASGDVNGDNFDDILVGGNSTVELYGGLAIDRQGGLDGKATAAKTALLSEQLYPYGNSYTGGIEVTSGYVLQRPDAPNGAAAQTYHANITTLALGTVPQKQQSVKVFTLTGGHAMKADSTQKDMATTANLGIPASLRLDAEFTPSDKVTKLYGTFADLPDQPRGEPVIYAQNAMGGTNLIHLGDKNVPKLTQLSSKSI